MSLRLGNRGLREGVRKHRGLAFSIQVSLPGLRGMPAFTLGNYYSCPRARNENFKCKILAGSRTLSWYLLAALRTMGNSKSEGTVQAKKDHGLGPVHTHHFNLSVDLA